jgi:hypothetical protein
MAEDREARESDELFGNLQPGRPPVELRVRVLTAAVEALSRQPDFWTRLCSSRAMRLGWAAVVCLLIAGHLAVTPSMTRTSESADGDTAYSMIGLDSELEEIIRLPRIDQTVLAGLP